MSKIITTDIFIDNATKKHNNKYSYTNTVYVNSKTKVTITCPIHGDFEQMPDSHMRGGGCTKCKYESISNSMRSTQEEFITKAKNKHSDYYDYSQTTYTTDKNKIAIICPIHGEFTQRPNCHLKGKGCPSCANTNKKGGWSYSSWETAAKTSKHFNKFTLYLVRCWNDTEEFYKIGKTYTSISKRFRQFPYSWEIINQVEGTAEYVSTTETILHNKYKSYRYIPKIPFGGITECFTQKLPIQP